MTVIRSIKRIELQRNTKKITTIKDCSHLRRKSQKKLPYLIKVMKGNRAITNIHNQFIFFLGYMGRGGYGTSSHFANAAWKGKAASYRGRLLFLGVYRGYHPYYPTDALGVLVRVASDTSCHFSKIRTRKEDSRRSLIGCPSGK